MRRRRTGTSSAAEFPQGLLHRSGDRRAHAASRPAQGTLFAFRAEIEPPAPGTRLYGAAFGDQASGTVVNSAPDPDGGSRFLAVAQIQAAEAGAMASRRTRWPAGATRAAPLRPSRAGRAARPRRRGDDGDALFRLVPRPGRSRGRTRCGERADAGHRHEDQRHRPAADATGRCRRRGWRSTKAWPMRRASTRRTPKRSRATTLPSHAPEGRHLERFVDAL